MTKEILERIDTKLDIMIRLLASRAVEGRSKTEAILVLGVSGLETDLIAEIVGTTPGTVRARLSEAKRKVKVPAEEVTRGEESI